MPTLNDFRNPDGSLDLEGIDDALRDMDIEDPPGGEPPEGSIVLVHGATGTALQRFHSDGLWHATTRIKPLTWREVLNVSTHAVIVVYQAPEEV